MKTSEILFTRQHHLADRAGDHYDIRLVIGNRAHSFATRKEIPEPGKSIILYETSIHTKDYALRKRIVIPKGNYGSGTTTLDFVRKAKLTKNEEKGHFVLETSKGERFLLKPLPVKDKKMWLFKNLGETATPLPIESTKNMSNKYLNKVAEHLSNNKNLEPEDAETIDEANELLKKHNYQPMFLYNKKHVDQAYNLLGDHFRAEIKPLEVRSIGLSTTGGLAGGVAGAWAGGSLGSAVGGILGGNAGRVIGNVAGSIGGSVLASRGVYKTMSKNLYGKEERDYDKHILEEKNKKFLEHLSQNYQKN